MIPFYFQIIGVVCATAILQSIKIKRFSPIFTPVFINKNKLLFIRKKLD